MAAEKKAAKAKKAPKEPKEKKPKGQGIGAYVKERMLAGDENQAILDKVKVKFPNANTTLSSINWYRGNLRQKGEQVKSSRELKKANAPAKEPKAKKEPVAKKAVKAKAVKAAK